MTSWRGAGVLRRPLGEAGPALEGFGGLAGVPASVARRAKSLRTRPGLSFPWLRRRSQRCRWSAAIGRAADKLQKTLYGAGWTRRAHRPETRSRAAKISSGRRLRAAPARSGSASPGSGRTWPGRSPGPAGRRLTRSGGDQRREHPAPFARRGGRLLCLFRRARERCEVLGGIAGGDLCSAGRQDDRDRRFRRWRRRGGSQDGVGADGTRDRVEALGGTFRVESTPGSGTRLAAEIPLGGQER